jgi:hypothetical protein
MAKSIQGARVGRRLRCLLLLEIYKHTLYKIGSYILIPSNIQRENGSLDLNVDLKVGKSPLWCSVGAGNTLLPRP